MPETTTGQGPSFTGSNSDRQSIGLPGHCERCATLGHVRAHPDLGCGDVGCSAAHDEPPVPGTGYTLSCGLYHRWDVLNERGEVIGQGGLDDCRRLHPAATFHTPEDAEQAKNPPGDCERVFEGPYRAVAPRSSRTREDDRAAVAAFRAAHSLGPGRVIDLDLRLGPGAVLLSSRVTEEPPRTEHERARGQMRMRAEVLIGDVPVYSREHVVSSQTSPKGRALDEQIVAAEAVTDFAKALRDLLGTYQPRPDGHPHNGA